MCSNVGLSLHVWTPSGARASKGLSSLPVKGEEGRGSQGRVFVSRISFPGCDCCALVACSSGHEPFSDLIPRASWL